MVFDFPLLISSATRIVWSLTTMASITSTVVPRHAFEIGAGGYVTLDIVMDEAVAE